MTYVYIQGMTRMVKEETSSVYDEMWDGWYNEAGWCQRSVGPAAYATDYNHLVWVINSRRIHAEPTMP